MGGWRNWLGVALVIAGLARAALLVFGGPLAGYANQYDMHRTGACLGLFPAIEAPRDKQPTPDAPIDLYRKDSSDGGGACYRSTEVLIAASVAAVAKSLEADSAGFRLRWLGATKFALFAVAALLLAYALAPNAGASIGHGAIVLLVLADPVVTLWFNTLYTEFAIFWGLYVSIGCLFALAVGARGAPLLWLLLVSGLGALAFSREQFALLPPALVIAAAPWLARSSPSPYVLTLGAAVVTSMVSFGLLPRPVAITEANRADAYLGVVLPASSNPPAALATLGLPARCAPMIGATWYLQRGEDIHVVCPEVTRLPSTAFLRFLSAEPQLLARAAVRVLPATQAVAPPYVGTLAGTTRQEIGDLPWWRGSLLHAIVPWVPGVAFALLVAATIVAAFVGAAIAVARLLLRSNPGGGPLLAMLLGGTALYALATTVFGDGLSEAARHFLAGWLAMACALIAACAGLVEAVRRAVREPRSLRWTAPVSIVIVALGAWAVIEAREWTRAQPLALGVVDEPLGRSLAPTDVVVRGWAVDPFGVGRVESTLGEIKRAALPDPKPALPEPRLPGYPEHGRARFQVAFTAEELMRETANGPAILRTTVTSRAGAVTEIDRRTIGASAPQAASAITPTMEAATK